MNNLSKEEEKFLLKFNKTVAKIKFIYGLIGISFFNTILGLIVATKLKNKDGFSISIFFGLIGLSLLVVSSTYKKISKIITKLMQHIDELEKKAHP